MGKYTMYYTTPCGRCGEPFQKKSHTSQKFCEGCKPAAERERREAYNQRRRVRRAAGEQL